MYETNFGFHRQPFQCADHARAFYTSESIRAILPQLLHALRSDLGIAVLTGPAGVGKTSLVKHLQSVLSNEGRAVVCSGAGLESPSEFLQTLQSATQLRAGETSSESSGAGATWSRWAVVDQMRKTTEFWGPILLLIDDAQLLSVPVLNELRAFTEEEWNGRALVRCLIAGPLNLEEELARPSFADFSRRIRCHAFLQPLSSAESIAFLARHLEVVGGKLHTVFEPAALDLIVSASDGLPRCLSLLADESLVVAAEQSGKQANEDCVRKALTRLQHLAYPWNASPLRPENAANPYETSDERLSESQDLRDTAIHQSAGTSYSTGVIEIGGAGGVIEIGNNTNALTTVSSILTLNEKENALTSESTRSAVTATEPMKVESIQRYSADENSFEVGHRYQPDALETSDVVEMDQYSPFKQPTSAPEIVSSEEIHFAKTQHKHATQETSDVEQVVTTRFAEPLGSLSSADAAHSVFSKNDSSLNSDGTGRNYSLPDRALKSGSSQNTRNMPAKVLFLDIANGDSESPSRDLAEREIHGNIADGLSSRRPVFDRYTWISLGREVPSGPYSVSTAFDMQRVSGQHHDDFDIVPNSRNSMTFDRIPFVPTSDADIELSLTQASKRHESGAFLVSKSVTLTQPNDVESGIENINSVMPTTADSHPFVGVEHFSSSEFDGTAAVRNTALQVPATDNAMFQENTVAVASGAIAPAAIVTEADRLVIQTAIRFSLSQSFSSLSSSGGTNHSSSPAAFESSDPSVQLSTKMEQGWHDGQLIFEDNSSPESNTQRQVEEDSDSGTTTEKVSLNFEAARIARDEHSQATRETLVPPVVTDKFYTLPDTVRTIAWDLRSALTDTDEIAPLADSVASLRESVTSFQQGGRQQTSASNLSPSAADLSARYAGSSDSLVVIAKRRLQQPESSQVSASTPPETLSKLAASAAVTAVEKNAGPATTLSETAISHSVTVSVEPKHQEGQHHPTADFGQLFTRLRKLRSQVTEKR